MVDRNQEPEFVAKLYLSPITQVKFPNGRIVAMNRRERRRNHLYGGRLVKVMKTKLP